jgi:hypothetical protein
MAVPESVKVFESLNTKLLETGKWAITFVQVLGYLPHSIQNNKFLKFRWIGISVISNLAFVAALPVLILCFLSARVETADFFNTSYSYTETFIFTFVNMIRFLFFVGFKVLGLIQYRQIIDFWQQTSALLTKFSIAGFNFFGKDEYILIGVRKTCVRSAILIYAGTLFQFLSLAFIRASYFVPGAPDLPLYFNLANGLWFALMLLHAGNMVWILFFVNIYSGLFHLISRELQKAKDTSNFKSIKIDLKIQTCISLFYEVEANIESFNKLFGSRIIYELLISMIVILTFSFLSIQIAATFGNFTIAHIAYMIPTLIYLKNVNDLGSTASAVNKEFRKIVTFLEKSSQLIVSSRTTQQVSCLLETLFILGGILVSSDDNLYLTL